jgi:hypothetical protein
MKYQIFSEDALKEPGLVPTDVFRDFIASQFSYWDDEWEDEEALPKHPGWILRSGAIGLRKGATKEAIKSWEDHLKNIENYNRELEENS